MQLSKTLLIHLWCAPVTLLTWLFYILPLWLTKEIEYVGAIRCLQLPACAAFKVRKTNSWYSRMWKDWAGWAGPFVILSKDPISNSSDKVVSSDLTTTARHEHRHCQQWMWFGCLFLPAYLLASVYLYFFKKDKHAYLDNPFEKDARQYAGQLVEIPRDQWFQGPDDRWPFW